MTGTDVTGLRRRSEDEQLNLPKRVYLNERSFLPVSVQREDQLLRLSFDVAHFRGCGQARAQEGLGDALIERPEFLEEDPNVYSSTFPRVWRTLRPPV